MLKRFFIKILSLKKVLEEYNKSETLSQMNIYNGSEYEAIIVKGLLEKNNINVFQENAVISSVEPWLVSPGGFKPVTLRVNQVNLDEAKKIIKDFYKGVNNLEI